MLLHPRGRLFLQELSPGQSARSGSITLLKEILTVAETKWINFVMGVLPGWWLGKDDFRYPEPYIDGQRWCEELRKVGLSRTSVIYDGYLNNNIIAMSDVEDDLVTGSRNIVLLVSSSAHAEEAKLGASQPTRDLQDALIEAGYNVKRIPLDHASLQPLSHNQYVISALDLTNPFFSLLDQTQFEQFQSFIKQVKQSHGSIFWVTGACQAGAVDPRFAPVVGVARVLRTELDIDFALLEVPQSEWVSKLAIIAPRVFKEFQHERRLIEPIYADDKQSAKYQDRDGGTNPESEWAHVDGRILIGRYHFVNINEELNTKISRQSMLNRPVRKLEQHKPGLTSTLCWKAIEALPLGNDEVRVTVKAVGLNFKVGMPVLIQPFKSS